MKAGKLDASHARALRLIKEDRENYAEVVFFDAEEARSRVEGARRFIEAAVDLLAREHGMLGL